MVRRNLGLPHRLISKNFNCVIWVKSTEEAIEIANDTMYGLGAGVWTRDAHELYREIGRAHV